MLRASTPALVADWFTSFTTQRSFGVLNYLNVEEKMTRLEKLSKTLNIHKVSKVDQKRPVDGQ